MSHAPSPILLKRPENITSKEHRILRQRLKYSEEKDWFEYSCPPSYKQLKKVLTHGNTQESGQKP